MPAIGSSSTWSRTSTTSSTPDRRPAPASPRDRLLGRLRLVHPFPSILDGAVTAAIALVAGGSPGTALRLALAMTALQFAIGALNDVVDAPRDAGRKAGKPIPAGLVSIGEARLVVVWGLAVGLVLAAPSGPATLAVAVAGTSTGLVYDLRLKGTPWAWMAFAVGIPLLPLFAWLGAGGSLPRAFLVLVPVAALAGAAVALGNALVDVDRDRATRTLTPAVVLGEGRAWRALVSLHVIVYLAALVSIPFLGGGVGPGLLLAVIGAAIAALGVGLARGASAATRERGWELQAVGLGVMGAGWVLAVGSVG